MIDLRGKILLLVDDEVALLEVISIHLELCGAAVLTASDGNAAFQIFCAESIDLVISDVRMPGVGADGLTLLKKIRAKNASAPALIFMTGFSDHSNQEFMELGASAVLAKPFTINTLEEAIVRSLGLK